MSIPSAGRFLAAVDDANVRAFRGLVDRFLEESHERFPESASRLGLDEFNSRLGQNDIPAHRAQIRLAEHTLAAAEKLPEASFAGDDWLDRRTFLVHASHRIVERTGSSAMAQQPAGPLRRGGGFHL